MFGQQGPASHQGLDGQAAALQSLQHRVVGIEQALVAQAITSRSTSERRLALPLAQLPNNQRPSGWRRHVDELIAAVDAYATAAAADVMEGIGESQPGAQASHGLHHGGPVFQGEGVG